MSIEKLIGELTDNVASLAKEMARNNDLLAALTDKTAAAAGDKPAPKARASRAKKDDDKAPAADEKETASRGRDGRDDDRGSRSRDREDDRGRERDEDRGSRGRNDRNDDRDESRPSRDRETRGDDRGSSKSLDPYDLAKAFLDYGKDDDKEDEDERDRRTEFLEDMFKFLGVKKARDIPEKEGKNMRRWFELYEDKGARAVDFDRD